MTEQAERIDLDSPLAGDFQAVVRLIIGGIAERVDFAFEEIDDLQLAVERLLAEAGQEGSVHLSFEVAEDTIRARVGPLRGRRHRRRACATRPSTRPGRSPSSASCRRWSTRSASSDADDGRVVVRLEKLKGWA